MSRKSRFQDIREAKDRRMKKIAIGGCVVLAAVLAFEIPHVLKRGGHTTSPPPATTTTPTTTAPGTAAAATATLTGAPAVLPNSDVAPSRSRSQLFSFSHFAGKDPFVQQVQDLTLGQPNAGGSGGAGATGTITAGAATQQSTTAVTTSSVRTLATTGTARISINGRVELVRVGKSFPSANPLFRLVSISHGVVKIGIAQGSYTSGAQTVTLAAGRPLTLVDTADGIRYKIRLLAAS